MSLLELEHVSKRYLRGHRELIALHNVSLELENGEVVSIGGGRGSGRTTLLRIAGGIERPDGGRVRFAGVDLGRDASPALRRQIAICATRFLPAHGRHVYQHVMMPLLAVGVPSKRASIRAHTALERVGATELALVAPGELVPAEAMRVALARAIVREPRLLIVDEPTNGVDPLERDPLLTLIQSIAHGSGISVLLSVGETASVTGADRCLRLSAGELLGKVSPTTATVVELRRSGAEPST